MPGEADGYYNNQPGYEQQGQPQYQPQNGQYAPPPGPPQDGQYDQKPPNYGQSIAPQAYSQDEKPTFEQTFKVEKPRWNDLWAAALFLIVFAGFVAVSGIAIQGYGQCKNKLNSSSSSHTSQLPLKASTEVESTTAVTTSASTQTPSSSSSSVSHALLS